MQHRILDFGKSLRSLAFRRVRLDAPVRLQKSSSGTSFAELKKRARVGA
jgi:hypothetical protein